MLRKCRVDGLQAVFHVEGCVHHVQIQLIVVEQRSIDHVHKCVMMVELVQDLWKDAGLELRTQVDERAGVEVLALFHEHLSIT